jgi:MFS transporter, DHA1 family, inner membrane transport protein
VVPSLDARRLRLALLALAVGGFTIGTAEFLIMGLLPQVARGVDVSISTAGHAISAYALGVVVGAPLLAAFGARFPRRRMVLGLMAAYAMFNFVSALAPSYEALVISRFFAGLPHGAYFGIAALIAAELSPPERRGRSVSMVILGLSVANVIGVPAVTWLGQAVGWRTAFVVVAALAAITVASIIATVPHLAPDPDAGVRRELSVLKRPQVWLALGICAIGGGGMFAIYSYISPILTDRTGVSEALVPVALAVWGVGMIVGSIVGGRLGDWDTTKGLIACFTFMVAAYALYVAASMWAVTAIAGTVLLGSGLAMGTLMQIRLMDVAGDAQTLAASLNHSAFNAANALGAWAGGAVIAAGWGLAAPMWLAVGFTLAGLALVAVSSVIERRQRQPAYV